jgi:hypothetical protein
VAEPQARFWKRLRAGVAAWNLVLAGVCMLAFVITLLEGGGTGSLNYLAFAAWWVLLGSYWQRGARRGARREELRARRRGNGRA